MAGAWVQILCGVAVAVCTIVLSSMEADAQRVGYCTAYRVHEYTTYYSRSSGYRYKCGWKGWWRCRETRYHLQTNTGRRYESYTTCCPGYGTSTCHALCWGATFCPNQGICNAPNTCVCTAGWSGSRCTTDVNECTRGTDRCHSRATCHNTDGSYTCSCNTGYTGSGRSCTDVNECTRGTDRCHPHAICHNTQGSYTCSCNSGYQGNGFSCNNINECLSNNGSCHHFCRDLDGNFACSCNTDYQLNGDGQMCEDVNECTTGDNRCHHHATCHNTQGSYSCSCNTGYTGDGFSCTDVNECTIRADTCHDNATCHNIQGSYTCSCNHGYIGNGFSCSDVNECTSDNNTCHDNATCQNTQGSYTCSCNLGYTGNGFFCTEPTIHYPMTTVESTLDSRTQPLATEHAVPLTSTQLNLPVVIGMTSGGLIPIVITTAVIIVGCVIIKRRRASKRSRKRITSDMEVTKEYVLYEVPTSMVKMTECNIEKEQKNIKMKQNVSYEAPPSRIKMTECEAYGTLPKRP